MSQGNLLYGSNEGLDTTVRKLTSFCVKSMTGRAAASFASFVLAVSHLRASSGSPSPLIASL
ncbi:hypothetical protein [Paenibacillus gorillae]|uniref:hypothetical protein n=1 Tax=Paenibacillus gorillae TaxID=1243662 RepID=UPI0009E0A529|nr:hypothetical protein [Paenibacillus gorillae]